MRYIKIRVIHGVCVYLFTCFFYERSAATSCADGDVRSLLRYNNHLSLRLCVSMAGGGASVGLPMRRVLVMSGTRGRGSSRQFLSALFPRWKRRSGIGKTAAQQREKSNAPPRPPSAPSSLSSTSIALSTELPPIKHSTPPSSAPLQIPSATAFGRCKGSARTTAAALFLYDLQIVSVRPSPHILNNLPPPSVDV